MKQLLAALCLALACTATSARAPTDQQAVDMAERGAALIKAKGKREMMERIHAKDPQFVQAGVSLTMRDTYTATLIADPTNPSLVGSTDADGVFPGSGKHARDVIDLAQRANTGWLDSVYRDPSGRSARKKTYIRSVGDVVLEAGIYQP